MKAAQLGSHLKRSCTNAGIPEDKREASAVGAEQLSYAFKLITVTWGCSFHTCRAAVQGYRFFRKGRVVRCREEVVCEKRCLRDMKLHFGNMSL